MIKPSPSYGQTIIIIWSNHHHHMGHFWAHFWGWCNFHLINFFYLENVFTIYIYIDIDYTKTWNTFMIKLISNSLKEKDKQQLNIVLQRYNNRLQRYKDIVNKAPPKRSSEEYKNKVVEDTITRSRGRPKKDYTEEEIEALKQKKEILLKDITKIILKKENIKKQSGRRITDHW